jgi:YHS domain-containing protein
VEAEMLKSTFGSLLLLAAIGLGGCVENGRPASEEAKLGKPHGECLVCKYENDLACVDIEVDKDTPHTTIDGKEYYFCSKECQKDFLKDPNKYTAKK